MAHREELLLISDFYEMSTDLLCKTIPIQFNTYVSCVAWMENGGDHADSIVPKLHFIYDFKPTHIFRDCIILYIRVS